MNVHYEAPCKSPAASLLTQCDSEVKPEGVQLVSNFPLSPSYHNAPFLTENDRWRVKKGERVTLGV